MKKETEFHVDAAKGNDTNDGSENYPLKTIQKAVEKASELIGDIMIHIKPNNLLH